MKKFALALGVTTILANAQPIYGHKTAFQEEMEMINAGSLKHLYFSEGEFGDIDIYSTTSISLENEKKERPLPPEVKQGNLRSESLPQATIIPSLLPTERKKLKENNVKEAKKKARTEARLAKKRARLSKSEDCSKIKNSFNNNTFLKFVLPGSWGIGTEDNNFLHLSPHSSPTEDAIKEGTNLTSLIAIPSSSPFFENKALQSLVNSSACLLKAANAATPQENQAHFIPTNLQGLNQEEEIQNPIIPVNLHTKPVITPVQEAVFRINSQIESITSERQEVAGLSSPPIISSFTASSPQANENQNPIIPISLRTETPTLLEEAFHSATAKAQSLVEREESEINHAPSLTLQMETFLLQIREMLDSFLTQLHEEILVSLLPTSLQTEPPSPESIQKTQSVTDSTIDFDSKEKERELPPSFLPKFLNGQSFAEENNNQDPIIPINLPSESKTPLEEAVLTTNSQNDETSLEKKEDRDTSAPILIPPVSLSTAQESERQESIIPINLSSEPKTPLEEAVLTTNSQNENTKNEEMKDMGPLSYISALFEPVPNQEDRVSNPVNPANFSEENPSPKSQEEETSADNESPKFTPSSDTVAQKVSPQEVEQDTKTNTPTLSEVQSFNTNISDADLFDAQLESIILTLNNLMSRTDQPLQLIRQFESYYAPKEDWGKATFQKEEIEDLAKSSNTLEKSLDSLISSLEKDNDSDIDELMIKRARIESLRERINSLNYTLGWLASKFTSLLTPLKILTPLKTFPVVYGYQMPTFQTQKESAAPVLSKNENLVGKDQTSTPFTQKVSEAVSFSLSSDNENSIETEEETQKVSLPPHTEEGGLKDGDKTPPSLSQKASESPIEVLQSVCNTIKTMFTHPKLSNPGIQALQAIKQDLLNLKAQLSGIVLKAVKKSLQIKELFTQKATLEDQLKDIKTILDKVTLNESTVTSDDLGSRINLLNYFTKNLKKKLEENSKE